MDNDAIVDHYVSRVSKKRWEIINRTDKGIQVRKIKKANALGIIVGICLLPFWGIGFVMLLLVLIDYVLQREIIKFITVNQMIKQMKVNK